MGSPYLLAHGLGEPVRDAVTRVDLPRAGTYRVWVRTRDWALPRKAGDAPGRFKLLVDGRPLDAVFGTEGAEWRWQFGGWVEIAGTCAAISAARHGITAALIQDRPVVGGNNSSEVRVWLNGGTNLEPYPRIGDVVRELEPRRNVTMPLNRRVNGVETSGGRIAAVLAQDIRTGRRLRIRGRWFADCSGDGAVGAMAGRDISVTHEALGTVRVMRTGGMMGEVVGMAAYLCARHSADPCAVYRDHIQGAAQEGGNAAAGAEMKAGGGTLRPSHQAGPARGPAHPLPRTSGCRPVLAAAWLQGPLRPPFILPHEPAADKAESRKNRGPTLSRRPSPSPPTGSRGP